MSYAILRVRNSPAGRVKPIRMKCFDKSQEDSEAYYLNRDFSEVCQLFRSFIKELNLNCLYYNMRVFKGVYKGYTYPYIQAYITNKDAPPFENAYKSKEEVAKYICKYFWSYEVEKQFIENANIRKRHMNYNISEKEYMAYSDEMRLTTSGLINISEERNKYYETGKCDFHSIIYNLFCKYLDNPNYIKDTITAASAVSF